MDKNEHCTLILAALLHDVGVVWARAKGAKTHAGAAAPALRGLPHLFPAAWRDSVYNAVERHHSRPAAHLGWVIRAADRLASGQLAERGAASPALAPLRPILAQVDVGLPPPAGDWGYPLQPLSGHGPLFPQDGLQVSQADYQPIRDGLLADLSRLAECGGVADLAHITGLLSILRRWTTYVPAPAAGEEDEEYPLPPDINLYDHLRLTGTVAACLAHLEDGELESLVEGEPEAWAKPVALMLRADLSGIQGFIYRITASRADGTFAGAARRLRGRSLYLVLLADVIVAWLLRQLGLSSINVLFNGGGRFDLLLPLETRDRIGELEQELQQWLLKTFYGELGIQLAVTPVRPSDFADMRDVYGALDDGLATSKRRKFEPFVRGQAGSALDFHVPHDQRHHACNVCHLTPLSDPGICEMCKSHEHLGRKLPTTSHVAFLYGGVAGRLPELKHDAAISFSSPFQATVALLDDDEAADFLRLAETLPGEAALYRLNDTDFIPPRPSPNVALGFRFLANEAPLDAHGNVLDFDGIAEQSTGAHLLGVLKADIDRLGFIFGEGIAPPTLSRVSALSGAMELFFGEQLGALCRRVAPNAFYTVYAAGDDLLILGPWDQVVELALELHADFRRYACHNENVTLSAGVLLVKPHFPIHRFARLVGDALDEAKNSGRNQVTAFTETVAWGGQHETGYDQLLEFGRKMAEKVEGQELPKGFVYFLKRLHDAHFDEEGWENPMWVPKLYYAIARQVKQEVVHDLDLLSQIPNMIEYIQVPVSYVSLKTRKE